MTERMIFGGAVMTSALVCGSAQMVTLLSPPPRPARRRSRRAPPPAAATVARCPGSARLQLGGDLLGVGVVQVAHLRVAARLERRVEMRDQRLDAAGAAALSPLTSTLLVRSSATTCTVGAAAAFGARAVLSERVDDAHDLGGRWRARSGITSMSSSPAWSMRWMMRIMRFTLPARSEMISMFDAG